MDQDRTKPPPNDIPELGTDDEETMIETSTSMLSLIFGSIDGRKESRPRLDQDQIRPPSHDIPEVGTDDEETHDTIPPTLVMMPPQSKKTFWQTLSLPEYQESLWQIDPAAMPPKDLPLSESSLQQENNAALPGNAIKNRNEDFSINRRASEKETSIISLKSKWKAPQPGVGKAPQPGVVTNQPTPQASTANVPVQSNITTAANASKKKKNIRRMDTIDRHEALMLRLCAQLHIKKEQIAFCANVMQHKMKKNKLKRNKRILVAQNNTLLTFVEDPSTLIVALSKTFLSGTICAVNQSCDNEINIVSFKAAVKNMDGTSSAVKKFKFETISDHTDAAVDRQTLYNALLKYSFDAINSDFDDAKKLTTESSTKEQKKKKDNKNEHKQETPFVPPAMESIPSKSLLINEEPEHTEEQKEEQNEEQKQDQDQTKPSLSAATKTTCKETEASIEETDTVFLRSELKGLFKNFKWQTNVIDLKSSLRLVNTIVQREHESGNCFSLLSSWSADSLLFQEDEMKRVYKVLDSDKNGCLEKHEIIDWIMGSYHLNLKQVTADHKHLFQVQMETDFGKKLIAFSFACQSMHNNKYPESSKRYYDALLVAKECRKAKDAADKAVANLAVESENGTQETVGGAAADGDAAADPAVDDAPVAAKSVAIVANADDAACVDADNAVNAAHLILHNEFNDLLNEFNWTSKCISTVGVHALVNVCLTRRETVKKGWSIKRSFKNMFGGADESLEPTNFTIEEVTQIMEQQDEDHNGLFEENEFLSWVIGLMNKKFSKAAIKNEKQKRKRIKEEQKNHEKVEKESIQEKIIHLTSAIHTMHKKYCAREQKILRYIFTKYDGDNNGHLNLTELKDMFDGVLKTKTDEKLVQKVMNAFDEDHNGTVEAEEFIKWMKIGLSRTKEQREIFARKSQLGRIMTGFLEIMESKMHERSSVF